MAAFAGMCALLIAVPILGWGVLLFFALPLGMVAGMLWLSWLGMLLMAWGVWIAFGFLAALIRR
jgi:hypothetical protein